ncbi:MAG: GGDEF domain-containing protein [Ruthenibacterium sp.]
MQIATDAREKIFFEGLSFWDDAPVAFGVAAADGAHNAVLRYANHALSRLLERNDASLAGLSIAALLPDTGAQWARLLNDSIQSGAAQSTTTYCPALCKTLSIKTYRPLPNLAACFLRDVSARVHLAQTNAAAQKRLSLILRNTTDAVFDFDLASRTLYNSSEAVARYGATPVMTDVPQSMLAGGFMRAEGAQALEQALCAMDAGATEYTLELLMRFNTRVPMAWHEIKLLRYTDALQKQVTVLGYLRNVDAQHCRQDALRTAAERDALTGLYNRGAAERRCIPALRSTGSFALFVFDVDNFKQMNDTRGHSYGDAMLRRFGEVLQRSFRQDELVWRQGGDEFCACIFGDITREVLTQRCNAVLHSFSREKIAQAAHICAAEPGCGETVPAAEPDCGETVPAAEPDCGETVSAACLGERCAVQSLTAPSCSIGVAFGSGPRGYRDCFIAADTALLNTKKHGKKGYLIVEMK